MRSKILILVVTIMMAGCAIQGRFNQGGNFTPVGDCDDRGGTFVNLKYGNNEIRTVAVAHVRVGEIFEIRLQPKNDQYNRPTTQGGRALVDYRDFNVTISGKDAASMWLSAGPASWHTAPQHKLVICVPKNQAIDHYYYNIEIDQTGSLDPRVDVD